jgi:hypothetical protein
MTRERSKDFEEIYLRMPTLKRFVHKADEQIMQDPNFQKTVKYMTARYFNGYKSFLKGNGFDRDDLENIINLFGLAFMGMPQKEGIESRDLYGLMMRFIQQKCNFFLETIGRKFNSNDTIIVSFDHFSGIEGSKPQQEDEESRAEWLDNSIFMIEEKMKTCSTDERFTLKMTRNEFKKELTKANDSIDKKKREFNGSRKETLDKLRQLFLADPHKYSNQLSHYATTKHVSKDIRKKARLMCNKYGIDYKKWLKEKLNDYATDSIEFDCT